jgi:photosystem II stability/assembly factor-like uncharacterized protein
VRSRPRFVGLAALVAVNAALVPMALRTTHGPTGPDRSADSPDRTAGVTARIAPGPQAPGAATPGAAPPGAAPPGAAPPAGRAAALDTGYGIAVQAMPGSCGGEPGALQLTVDGGRQWRTLPVPTGDVLRIIIASSDRIWLVGTDPGCQERVYFSVDRGATWRILRSTGTWHRLADAAAPWIQTPRGPVPSPCAGPVAEVAASNGSTGAVRCGDGTLYRTNDGGRTWSAVAAAGAVRALAFANFGQLYAVSTGDAGCGGWRVSVRPVDTWEPLGCVPGDAASAPAVALSFADPNAGLLVAGTTTYATADGGRTWERRDRPVDNHRPVPSTRSI